MRKSKRQIVSIMLLLAMLIQLLPASVFAAKSTASIEVLIVDDKGAPVSGGRVRVLDDRGRQLSFTTKNGLYEYDIAGFYNEGKTETDGSLIFTGLAVGNYKVEHLSGAGEVIASHDATIISISDFEEIKFKLPKEESNKPNSDNKPVVNVEKKGLVFSFNSSGINYRIKSSNGKTIMLTQLDAGNYQAGGKQASFKSNRNISIHGLKPGNYMLEGNGVRYKIKYNGTYNGYNIDDKEVDRPTPQVIENSSKVIVNLRDKRTGGFYQGGRFALVDSNGKKIGLIQDKNKYNYDSNINDNIIVVNGESIEINGLPNGSYTLLDTTSNDDPKLDDIEFRVSNNETETIDLSKGVIKNDALITILNEDEEEVDGYVFNVIGEDDSVLNFVKKETEKDDKTIVEYVYTTKHIDEEDVVDEVEIDSEKNIKLRNIPFNKIELEEVKINKKYEPKEKEEVTLSYKEETKHNYLVEQKKFIFNLLDEEEDVVSGVEFMVKESGDKEEDDPIFVGESDENGVLEIKGLDIEKDYILIATKVPSPYALPFDGKEYEIAFDDEEELSDKINVPFANFIAKTDSKTEGSIFSFVNESGEEVYRLTSDDRGYIGVDRIEHGKYVVTQITAAEGFKVDREKFELVIDETYVNPSEEDLHIFHNPKIGEESEDTEENLDKDGSIVKKAVIFILCLIALVLIYLTLVNLDYKDKHGENKYAFFTKIERLFGKKDEGLTKDVSKENKDLDKKKDTTKKDK